MATSTLVRIPTDEAVALMILRLEEKGIRISEQFWMTPSELHWRVLGLVSPDADAPDGYNLHRKIYPALDGFAAADPVFLGTRMMVFGETELRNMELEKIRSGYVRLPEIGPYTEVEIARISSASDIRKSGDLSLIPDDPSDGKGIQCTVVFAGFGGSGARPYLKYQDESEVIDILKAFQIPATRQNQILESLRQGRTDREDIPNVDLRTLYRLGLI